MYPRSTPAPSARASTLSPPRNVFFSGLACLALSGALLAVAVSAAGFGGAALAEGMLDQPDLVQPAPAAVADYFPMAYAGQALLGSASIDADANTVTFPLHRGAMRDGRAVWYVLTDSSDLAFARRLGLHWSPKLLHTPDAAARTATMNDDGSLTFDQGTVDFAPERMLTPGEAPAFFPPAVAEPGSVGDADYSPLVRVTNAGGLVLNATVVAFDVEADEIEFPNGGIDYRKVIDRAVAISPAQGWVRFGMSLATASGRPVLFVSLDSNSPLVSALESTTYAPALQNLPTGLGNRPDSAVAANYIVANGPTGVDNPQRQGLNSALGDQGAQVLDIFSTVPDLLNGEAYSPMWDLYVAEWTEAAIDAGYRSTLRSELDARAMAARGWLTSPGGAPLGSSGLVSNCPVLMHF